MFDDDAHKGPASKIATAILSTVSLGLVMAFLLARAADRLEQHNERAQTRCRELENTLGRFRAVQLQSKDAVRGLCLATLYRYGTPHWSDDVEDFGSDPPIPFMIVDSGNRNQRNPIYVWEQHTPEYDADGTIAIHWVLPFNNFGEIERNWKPSDPELPNGHVVCTETEAFADCAEEICQSLPVKERLGAMLSAVRTHVGSESRRKILEEHILAVLADLDSPTHWPTLCQWITYGEFHRGGFSVSNPLDELTYPEFQPEADREYHDRAHMRSTMMLFMEDRLSAQKWLQEQWQVSYERRWQNAQEPLLSIPRSPFSFPVSDLLCVLAPIIVGLQILYLLFIKRHSEQWESNSSALSKSFPRFGTSMDPMTVSDRRTLAALAARLVWALFLSLPPLLLALVCASRYNFFQPWYQDESPLFAKWVLWRQSDVGSWLADIMNLGCLMVSLLVTIELTCQPPLSLRTTKTESTLSWFTRFHLAPALALLTFIFWLPAWHRILAWTPELESWSIYLVGGGMYWGLFAGAMVGVVIRSAQHRSRIVFVIGTLLLASGVALFWSGKPFIAETRERLKQNEQLQRMSSSDTLPAPAL